MANWYGSARSNHVRFTNVEALQKSFDELGIDIKIEPSAHGEGYHWLRPDSGEGGWPGILRTPKDEAALDEFSFEEHVCPFLLEGDVLIILEVGAEKLRYLTGWAKAYNRDGFVCEIDLNDIYGVAADELSIDREEITDAIY